MPSVDDPDWSQRREQLTRAVRRLGSGFDDALVDDLVQQGMERLMRKPEAVNATYVWRTAWSVICDLRRRQRRRPEHGDKGLAFVEDQGPRPDASVAETDLRRALRACLEQAPESRREVLTLYLVGHGPTECAEMLNRTLKSCENAVYRGLEALRECLRSKGVA
jgi:RNA polymerase sigma-70 factor (ECF subfamily)